VPESAADITVHPSHETAKVKGVPNRPRRNSKKGWGEKVLIFHYVPQFYIEYADESKVKIGARVETVFEEKRTGSMRDIKHFRVLE
jgi:hypothetical protein